MQVDFSIGFGDIVVYFIALIYAVIVLTVADLARRKMKWRSEFTRRIVHLFAGFAIWAVPYFPHPWVATLVGFTFVVMLALANHERFRRFFEAMARPEDLEHGSVRGPLWYAVSITVLTAAFTMTGYHYLYFIPAAAIQIMMLGDGMSAPIGMRFGINSCRVIFGSKRSPHGCLAVLIFGFLGALLAFWFFGILNYGVFLSGSNILWMEMITLGLLGAITATIIEALSPKGMDNILLPFFTCAVLLFTGIALGIVAL